MTRRNHHPSTLRLASMGFGLLLVLCLLPAVRAQASFEQVATFDQSPHLWHSGGTAVNYTGAGGVPAGTVYSVSPFKGTNIFPPSVIRYSPQGEFRAAWGYKVGSGAGEYQRCGPDGDPLYPTCMEGVGSGGEGLGLLSEPAGVAVDQTTGNVYVLNVGRKHDSVQVFSADGSKRLGGFGERYEAREFPEPTESIEEGPEKFHRVTANGSAIAVDNAGRVYVPDNDFAEAIHPLHARVMVFEPESPGDYEHYVYSGRANDIDKPYAGDNEMTAVDSTGNVYVGGDSGIREYAAGDHHQLCQLELAAGGISAMTVNPTSGDVFYFTYKKGGSIRRLRCNGEGEFKEVEEFASNPKVASLTALSFNPTLSYSSERPAGALYAVAPDVINSATEKFEFEGRGYVFAPTAVHAPEVNFTAALEITPSSAVLHASVNPKGAQANYVFQYISEAAYEANEPGERFAGASEAPPGGAVLEPGVKFVAVAAVLQGLTPDTPYRYRVVAENCVEGEEPELCTTDGETGAFRTFPVEPAGPPDHRTYELVSPVQKGGGEVFPARSFVNTPSCLECRPGAYGQRFPKLSSPDGERVVYDGDAFSSIEGNKSVNEYFSQRTSSGWQTKTLTPTLMREDGGHRGFSSDLGRAVFLQAGQALLPSAPAETPNIYTQSTGEPGSIANLIGEEAPNEGEHLSIRYAGASIDLGHVFFSANDALTGETPFAPGASYEFQRNNLYESFEGELRLVNVLPGNAGSSLGASFGAGESSLSHAISDDGSRAFWSDASGQVYVREDGETTREIPEPGEFLTASADGSKVLLRGGELYDLETETAVDLTQGQGGFKGIAGQSEDLSRIYFVDDAVLDETPNGNGDSAKVGKSNLYAWHEGAIAFVASLSGTGQVEEEKNWTPSPANRTAEASPDGRWLAFQSSVSLTGFDNVGVCVYLPAAGTAQPIAGFGSGICAEVYLYDAETGELRCPSCASTGEAPRGQTTLPLLDKVEGSAPQVSYINNEGRLYFDTANRLSPQDSNGVIEDVYEFEPEGVGSCERADGCVVLVSSGHGSSDANLAAVDETGKNVFFTSRDQLALKDQDALIDLYDAREGGGIAAESESLRSECQGEACQPAAIDPNDPTPSSASFHGKGNVSPEASKRCPKGKRKVSTRGRVRCVARKPNRHRKAAHRRATRNHGGAK